MPDRPTRVSREHHCRASSPRAFNVCGPAVLVAAEGGVMLAQFPGSAVDPRKSGATGSRQPPGQSVDHSSQQSAPPRRAEAVPTTTLLHIRPRGSSRGSSIQVPVAASHGGGAPRRRVGAGVSLARGPVPGAIPSQV
eukprot:GHVU01113450.1.p2 GENE.GHVU01113450.1~~GHVU01113450.1.p2  ORF type:complete len:137 (-),score=5.92 GHVU01113450.1:214-624(-)